MKKKINKSKIGRKSRRIGLGNQSKSVEFILSNPQKYGVYDKSRVYKAIGMIRYLNVDLFGLWDIITMPDSDYPIYLIQVKTNWKRSYSSHQVYEQSLKNFKTPDYVQKELHVWYSKSKKPSIFNLNHNYMTEKELNDILDELVAARIEKRKPNFPFPTKIPPTNVGEFNFDNMNPYVKDLAARFVAHMDKTTLRESFYSLCKNFTLNNDEQITFFTLPTDPAPKLADQFMSQVLTFFLAKEFHEVLKHTEDLQKD